MDAASSTAGFPDSVLDDDGGVLLGMLDASSEACWCMEFGEPVDLGAPDREVVRQVFENRPYWRFCNAAMARLYLLPGGECFDLRPVREIFPRTAQNEAFVRALIDGGFEMNRAPARDVRYDGVEIDVENDVRAHIAGGQMLRMFGVVRDVGRHRRREHLLQRRLDGAVALLDAMPTPFVALDANGIVVATNPAADELVGHDHANLAGRELRHVLHGRMPASSVEAILGAVAEVSTDGAARSLMVDGASGPRSCSVTRHEAGEGGGVLLVLAPAVATTGVDRPSSTRRGRVS